MSRRPVIPDRRTALLAGVGFVVLGSWLVYDAYEHRGMTRPWALRLLPGA